MNSKRSLAVAMFVGAALLGPVAPIAAGTPRPNIVFVLTDDLSTNLVTKQFMPNLWALEHQGATFTNYFVSDSLCCPSRASIFTGRFPHDTGVYENSGPNGGDSAFNAHNDEASTLATDLQAAGYRTAMMGKYLNRYHMSDPTPPGWTSWDVADWGYPEFNYTLKQDGRVVHYGGPEHKSKDNYLTDVLSGLADAFVTSETVAQPSQPFFLEVATFAPHSPYTPAPKYAGLYPGLKYPKTPAYGVANTAAPDWLGDIPALGPKAQAEVATDFRLRAQDVKSVDDLIGNLVATLRRTGALSDTYFVFSSDNGLHMGEHDLRPGKLTAFDTDIHVPLIVVGPHIVAGSKVSAFAENVDLRSTFDALAGTSPSQPVDGRSLAPLALRPQDAPVPPPGWPQGVLVEHYGPVEKGPDEPDAPEPSSGNPPSYRALRLAGALYVEYSDGEHEYYNLTNDPYEIHNVYGSLPQSVKLELHQEIVKLERCHDQEACSDVRPVTQ